MNWTIEQQVFALEKKQLHFIFHFWNFFETYDQMSVQSSKKTAHPHNLNRIILYS